MQMTTVVQATDRDPGASATGHDLDQLLALVRTLVDGGLDEVEECDLPVAVHTLRIDDPERPVELRDVHLQKPGELQCLVVIHRSQLGPRIERDSPDHLTGNRMRLGLLGTIVEETANSSSVRGARIGHTSDGT
jgi:hypothetical protein